VSSADPKQRLFTQAAPARVGGIADAIVIKDGDLAFVCRNDGAIPDAEHHGLGLYYRDCRYLDRYDVELAGARLEALAASSTDGFRSVFQLTNPELEHAGKRIGRQELGVRLRHVIDCGDHALRSEIAIRNYHLHAHSFPLTVTFDADFADIFVIRELIDERPGTRHDPVWDGEGLVFAYDGGDAHRRKLVVRFSEPPSSHTGTQVSFDISLAPQEETRLLISFAVFEYHGEAKPPVPRSGEQALVDAEDAFERSLSEWLEGFTRVESSSPWLDRVVDRSLRDLRSLHMTIDGHGFFAAGVPWFCTLFGRDSLLCALQTLAFRPEHADDTLRLLASLQGQKVDAFRDEEPGKILHELRVGELARMGIIPHTPYYGTVDATPLFLIVLAEYSAWTGTLDLFHELRGNVERALSWMSEHGDSERDGYIDYRSPAAPGGELVNQGWKDAGDSIPDASGGLAKPPLALVEVQAYAYRAKQAIATLFERSGDARTAARLRAEADELRERFNRDFWSAKSDFLVLGLSGPSRSPIDVISSNPAHALWAGIVLPERAEAITRRLMADDLYSGWGIRTLSERERAYNPIGYHLGTVWPHDNAIAVAGFRRYGFDQQACRVFADLLEAATHFEHDRLPEAFSGFARGEYGVPVRYPVACHPQAWAAGSVPFMLQTLLGLEPDAFEHRLRVVRPCLPEFIDELRLEHLRVGGAELDLRFERTGGSLAVHVDRKHGELEVVVEPNGSIT